MIKLLIHNKTIVLIRYRHNLVFSYKHSITQNSCEPLTRVFLSRILGIYIEKGSLSDYSVEVHDFQSGK